MVVCLIVICRNCKSEIPCQDLIDELVRLITTAPNATDRSELRPGPPSGEDQRQFLIKWLTNWRAKHGLSKARRSLGNRSTEQLKRMYEKALRTRTGSEGH